MTKKTAVVKVKLLSADFLDSAQEVARVLQETLEGWQMLQSLGRRNTAKIVSAQTSLACFTTESRGDSYSGVLTVIYRDK